MQCIESWKWPEASGMCPPPAAIPRPPLPLNLSPGLAGRSSEPSNFWGLPTLSRSHYAVVSAMKEFTLPHCPTCQEKAVAQAALVAAEAAVVAVVVAEVAAAVVEVAVAAEAAEVAVVAAVAAVAWAQVAAEAGWDATVMVVEAVGMEDLPRQEV